MARALVTGGAGFIGSHIAHALLQRGDQVRVLDNLSSGDRANLSDIHPDIEFIRGDLRHPEDVKQAVNGIDLIFHEGAFVSLPESLEKPGECYDVNVNGTIHLLEAARLAGVQRVVLASSAAVYGVGEQLPFTEAMPTDCISPYAASKYMTETLAHLYTATFGLPTAALRYFNVYGPKQSPTSQYAAAIPKFIARMVANQPSLVFGDGTQTRDFIFVGDVVRANLLAAEAPEAPGRAFNVCSGQETSLLDLLAALATVLPNAPAPEFAASRPGDVARSLGDPRLAADVLGFQPTTALVEGLRQCVEAWPA